MLINVRDLNVLKHIIEYCDQIGETNREFDDDYDKFLDSNTYRNALSLCILQIGELVTVLSDEFKEEYKEIPWRDIKAMRNIVAHRYGTVDKEMLWNTVHEDVPELKGFCKTVLGEI